MCRWRIIGGDRDNKNPSVSSCRAILATIRRRVESGSPRDTRPALAADDEIHATRYTGNPDHRIAPMLRTVPGFDRIGEENAFAVLARATELARQGKDIINLGIGQPDFRTPEHIVEAAIKALRDGHHGYTPATGILPLREAVAADIHRRLKVEVSPERVVIVPGGKVTMFMAILMFGEPGAEIMYPDPGFPIYRSMIEFTGATPVPIPIREQNGFAFSAAETLSLITPRTRLIIVNSPANPTGGVTPKAEIDALIAGLDRYPDIAVMSDEIYGQMTYDGSPHVSLLEYPSIRNRLILLDGWSKTYAMTGWRMGFSVWPDGLFENARKLAVNSYSCVNAPAQFAGLAALTGPQDAVHSMVAEFDRRRAVVVEGLNKLPGVSCIVPKGAFYAFPNVSATGWKAKALASALLEDAGVATIGGPDFGVHGEGYMRLSYANSTENILRALDRIRGFLERRNAA
jgi:aspartate/methionine/tyrosine aminotransferase